MNDLNKLFTENNNSNQGESNNFNNSPKMPKRKNIFFLLKKYIFSVVLGVFVIQLLSGFYSLSEYEQALVFRFGKLDRVTYSGLNYRIPFGIERAIKENVSEVKLLSFPGKNESSIMLTGDEKQVEVNFEVQWQINDLRKYMLSVKGGKGTIANVAQNVVREMIGTRPLISIITDGRSKIEVDALSQMKEILDTYDMGVSILLVQILKSDPPKDVIDSFREVQGAKVEKEKIINLAESYRADVVPKATGAAHSIISAAEAKSYRIKKISEGEIIRFNSLRKYYKENPSLVHSAIYMKEIPSIVSNIEKVIVGSKAKNVNVFVGEGSSGQGHKNINKVSKAQGSQ